MWKEGEKPGIQTPCSSLKPFTAPRMLTALKPLIIEEEILARFRTGCITWLSPPRQPKKQVGTLLPPIKAQQAQPRTAVCSLKPHGERVNLEPACSTWGTTVPLAAHSSAHTSPNCLFFASSQSCSCSAFSS